MSILNAERERGGRRGEGALQSAVKAISGQNTTEMIDFYTVNMNPSLKPKSLKYDLWLAE